MMTNTRSNKTSFGRRALSVLIMAAFIILVWLIVIHPAAAGRNAKETPVQYISLQIEEGDTLWSIASDHLPADQDVFHFMDQIRTVNHMHTDTIIASRYLIIPIYA
ncbi:MAG: hypothetical protein K6A77_00700 [Clostridiales bacterium]|nr:hypothetical protein [Clostridiales bacterium]